MNKNIYEQFAKQILRENTAAGKTMVYLNKKLSLAFFKNYK